MPLSGLLERAVLKPEARYVVFHCADTMDQGDDAADEDTAPDDEADGRHPPATPTRA